jgi:hypothetical protein
MEHIGAISPDAAPGNSPHGCLFERRSDGGLSHEGLLMTGTTEQSPTVLMRRDEAARLGDAAVLRNEPKDVSRAIEGTTDDSQGSLRNEPSAISEAFVCSQLSVLC